MLYYQVGATEVLGPCYFIRRANQTALLNLFVIQLIKYKGTRMVVSALTN